jgi:quinol monooxygenase YgiN
MMTNDDDFAKLLALAEKWKDLHHFAEHLGMGDMKTLHAVTAGRMRAHFKTLTREQQSAALIAYEQCPFTG